LISFTATFAKQVREFLVGLSAVQKIHSIQIPMKTLAILFLSFLIIPNAIAQNPTLLTDAFEGPESSFPANLCSMNDLAIFTARNNNSNYELWKTDGTSSGTSMILEINADTLLGSMPEGFVYFNGNYFFTANDGHHGFELWKTDGTVKGFLSNCRSFSLTNLKLVFAK
jgi:ELWxxDGT repeat protein